MEKPDDFLTLDFKAAGDLIYLIGTTQNCINSSEYLYSYQKIKGSPAPYFEMTEELLLHETITEINQEKLINSCHDVSDGGVFIALSESDYPRGLGFEINLQERYRTDAQLFGEAQGRVVVSIGIENKEKLETFLSKKGITFNQIGTVTAQDFVVNNIRKLSRQL